MTSKEEYLDYRERAKVIYEGQLDGFLTIPLNANVQPREDGAFVEATVWVPKEK